MQYFVVEPEVPGELGPRTVLERSTHPPKVLSLHYIFLGWLGDHLVESFPVFLISKALEEEFQSRNVSGYRTSSAEIEVSPDLLESSPGLSIPSFLQMEIIGKKDSDDLFLAEDHRLVISERVKSIAEDLGTSHWDLTPM